MHLKITDAPYFVKIPIRLKIPASLKISVRSKNLYLKISVHQKKTVQSGAICPESCKGIQGEPERMQEYTTTTSTPTEYTHGTQDTTIGKRATTSIKIKFAYIIGIIAPNDKKNEKKLKKNWKFNFLPYLCSRNQTTNTPKGKKKIQVKQ